VPAKSIFAVCLVLCFAAGILCAPKAPAAVPGSSLRADVATAGAEATQIESRQDPAQKEMQDRMFKEANKKRQQDIKNDADKLFQLATELKAAVDKSNENIFSLDVVRKAEQVEKLAKKVKENMKEAFGPSQNVPAPVPVPTPFSH
jgi:hypothetical protein